MRKINKDTVWEILIENELVTLFQGCEKLSKVIEILELCEQEFPDIHTIMSVSYTHLIKNDIAKWFDAFIFPCEFLDVYKRQL